jgi:hypothetical protein
VGAPAFASDDDPDGVPRRQSKLSRPAEFEGPGLLQLELGYDGDFHSRTLRRDATGTLTALFNASKRLQLELDVDAYASQEDRSRAEITAFGDVHLGAQFTALSESEGRPSLAFAYLIKIPTATTRQGLGTGRADHKLAALSSRDFGAFSVDANAALLANEIPGGGSSWGAQVAIGASVTLPHHAGLQLELSGQTIDADQPKGAFALAGLTYAPTPRWTFDFGMRAGLTHSAPDFGVFGGVTLGLVNFYD